MREATDVVGGRLRFGSWVLPTALVLGLALGLVQFHPSAEFGSRLAGAEWSGTVVDPPEPMPAWALEAHSGERLDSTALHGRVQLLYFGYTACPDICPMTTAALAITVGGLDAAEREDVQVLMVSVDPERDSPERLASYLGAFDPAFIGLRGDEAGLAAVAEPLGAYYERAGAPADGNHRIDHTASVALIDRRGRLRSLYGLGFDPDALRTDIRRLLKE